MFLSAIEGFVEFGYNAIFHSKVAIFEEKFYSHINFKCLIIMESLATICKYSLHTQVVFIVKAGRFVLWSVLGESKLVVDP
jgi:hypothetical protein